MARTAFSFLAVMAWLVAVVIAGPAPRTEAAPSIVVDGSCTLVDAITAANTDSAVGACPAGSGTDTIVLTHDVVLTTVDNGENGLPKITSDITVDGNGHRVERADLAPDFRYFEVEEAILSLHHVVLSGGSADGGGAISATRALVRVIDSTLQDNRARYGGAIATLDVNLEITRSTIRSNIATDVGGGISSNGTGGTLGWLDVDDSTISDNYAEIGGGISIASTRMFIDNTTVSGNTAQGTEARGGGIAFFGEYDAEITNATIAANTAPVGAGLWTDRDEFGDRFPTDIDLRATIVSNELGNDCGMESPTIRSLGHNLVASPAGCGTAQPSDVIGGVADLRPLGDNGGPTETQALGAASDALDAIPPAECPTALDQRGTGRPQGAGCDIGAFESAGVTMTVDGDCTLVDAIDAANTDTAVGGCPAGSDADTIVLTRDVTLAAVHHGGSGLPAITSPITIRGDGHTVRRDPAAPAFRIFEVWYGGDLRLVEITVANGIAPSGGAIASSGSLSITASTIRDSEATRFGGGGIEASGGHLVIDSSTISGNVGRDGAGVAADGVELLIVNSTISGNGLPAEVDGTFGGGLSLNGDTYGEIRHTTIADNTAQNGSGVWAHLYGEFTIARTLLSNPGQDCVDLFHELVSEGYNISSSEEGCGFDQPTDANGPWFADLGPLDDNGGPTRTHGLLPTSTALNAIPAAACDIGLDQRGAGRPVGTGCDIGAVEGLTTTLTPSCADATEIPRELEALGYTVIVGPAPSGMVLQGTPGDDVIVGTSRRDVVDADDGDDIICGLGGSDTIRGGLGDDRIDGGHGNDHVRAGGGDDVVVDPGGSNRLYGQGGDDTITGGGAADVIGGGGGADVLVGLAGDDTIIGGPGGDLLRGGAGEDELGGDAGNDVLRGGADGDELRGGSGNDRLVDRRGANLLDGGNGARDLCRANAGDVVVDCER